MISILQNNDQNFSSIRAIAKEVWPIAYGAILSQAQLDYMIEMMYSVSSLQKQALEKSNQFILAVENDIPIGFASYELNCDKTVKTKIHKIYLLPNQQGRGIGSLLIQYILNVALQNNQLALVLNVNKYNPARYFYEKIGFKIIDEEVIAIGNGYVMDDYIMEYLIINK